ncbi:cyclin-domain-containing protein [Marasmius fiardii PR-910]|nr:cyclin-domain-containing protein [Marasmius fiardii PR-910]
MDSSGSGRVQLPPAFEDANIEHLIQLIADMLERLMSHNDRIPIIPESLTRFHSRSPPGISVLDYLKRIVKYCRVEKSCLLIVLFYIDQICSRNPVFTLSSLTCHRFVITAIAVSSKGLCDVFCPNSLYAKVGGISLPELNTLEREFLQMIGWQLTCTRELLQEYYSNLVRTSTPGQFVIIGPQPPPMESDTDIELSLQTTPSSTITEPSAILIDPSTIPQDVNRRPTIEQNMAFAHWTDEGRKAS